MAWTQKRLAFGQLPNSLGDLCDPTGAAVIHNIILHNANTTAETVELLYHDGTNGYQFLDVSLAAGDSLFLDMRGEGLVLPAGAKITGNTTTASKVTYIICGSEES